MPGPRYDHLVWNCTNLIVSKSVFSGSLSYAGAVGGGVVLADDYPPDNYAGEVIPPYAAMRIATNPVLYKDRICWPVVRPDDNSMLEQVPAIHFFNGPQPIPVDRYGWGTQDLPAPVLCDFSNFPPSSTYTGTSTGFDVIGLLVGFVSGSWALRPPDDVNAGFSVLGASWPAAAGPPVVPIGTLPYAVMGQLPRALANPPSIGPQDPPTLAFNYSSEVMIVGTGALYDGD